MIPNWHFVAARERDRNVDPAEDLFFESLPPLGAVIRESTQNSLDACDGSSKVKMRIAVNTGNNAMPADVAKKYFSQDYLLTRRRPVFKLLTSIPQ